jgi:DNA mismatch repair protein MutS
VAETPLRRQYLEIKSKYPDTVVFFRLGDFYETFDDDAAIVARVCDVVLTSRPTSKDQRIPMAGVPYHSAEGYIARLVAAGYKVAVAEQLSAPAVDEATAARRIRLGKKESTLTANWSEAGVPGHQVGKGRDLVERDVVRVVTPGTVTEPGMLDAGRNNYVAALIVEGGGAGIAYADITTGEFACTEIKRPESELSHAVQQELDRLSPAELLMPGHEDERAGRSDWAEWAGGGEGGNGVEKDEERRAPQISPNGTRTPSPSYTPPEQWALDGARRRLLRHLGAQSLEAYGCARLPLAIRAAGALVSYIGETNRGALGQLTRLTTYSTDQYMALDPQTRRNLEIADSPGGRRHSLLHVLDETRTPMGSRLLARWLNQPLLDINRLRARQDAIEAFVDNAVLRMEIRNLLHNLADLERLTARAVQGIAGPRDLVSVKTTLDRLPDLHASLSAGSVLSPQSSVLSSLVGRLGPCGDLVELIGRALVDDPPALLGTGEAIRPGFSKELDSFRASSRDAKGWIAGLEAREKERSGIRSLKVGYNKVFGYYIEVSHANREAIPADYQRKQTLVGAERYITPELKEYENLILNAQERLVELERAAFGEVLRSVVGESARLMAAAEALALLDVFTGLAEVAVRHNYVRPQLDEGSEILIREGRHPVVEQTLRDELFVPNDAHLDSQEAQVIILTGPNMAGKSVYIKSVALLVLMAQVGSFVPAEEARIGLVDRIYTRVGAQDDIATGRSTFMVEMEETAFILNHATPRSLIILDEIGRGTSTYDGLAIARAVVEYIHNSPRVGSKTLFATHYHELTELEKLFPRVRNYNVAVAEEGERVAFLHKIVPGGADRSYGIHVARLAGLPRAVIRRAGDILEDLERGGHKEQRRGAMRSPQWDDRQMTLPLAAGPDPVREELQRIKPDEMSPLEALSVLYELHKKAKEAG